MDNATKEKAPDWLLNNIAETTKNARKLFFMYLSAVVYCAVTIATISDRQIVFNEGILLPIIKLNVSLHVFFKATPFILILVFLYFQLYYRKVQQLTVKLQTNYSSIDDDRLYPWFIAEKKSIKTFIDRLQNIIVNLFLWWSLPSILMLFALKIVKKHDTTLFLTVNIAMFVGTAFSILFWYHVDVIDQPKNNIHGRTFRTISNNFGKIILALLVLGFQVLFIFIINPLATRGKIFLSDFTCVDLSYQRLSQEPNISHDDYYWQNLSREHLEGATLNSTILTRTNLRRARLQKASIISADLQGADLENASLQLADLRRTNFQEANLQRANFIKTNLREANLQSSNLYEAKLREAYLAKTNLVDANLSYADLLYADFTDANLNKANFHKANCLGTNFVGALGISASQLCQAETLYNATFDSELKNDLQLRCQEILLKPEAQSNQEEMLQADISPINIALDKPVRVSKALSSVFHRRFMKRAPKYANDGNQDSAWISGSSPPQWIEIDLQSNHDIRQVTLVLYQDVEGETVHQVWGKSESDEVYQLLGSFSAFTTDFRNIKFVPQNFLVWKELRFIKVKTIESPAWVAWREIEIIGN